MYGKTQEAMLARLGVIRKALKRRCGEERVKYLIPRARDPLVASLDVLAEQIVNLANIEAESKSVDLIAVVRPACRSAVVVDTDLSLEIVGQLRTLKQANDSRAWTLEQDVSLMHQMRNNVNICDVRVQGKHGEDAAANRLKVIEKRLPGISANVRRTTNMHALQEAEDTYANFKLPEAIVQALAEIDRSTSKRSTSWSLREDTLLLKKWLSDSEDSSTINIPGHAGEHAARRRLEQLRTQNTTIKDGAPIRIRAVQHANARKHDAAAFPWLLSDSLKQPTSLSVTEWTPMQHRPLCLSGTPLPGAEISFTHASARIPAKWTLQLNEQRFVLAESPRDADTPPETDHWSTYALDDVQPTSTAADVSRNIASWLRWQGIQINDTPIRLVHVKNRDMTPNDLEEWEPDMTAAEFDIYSKYARLIVTTFAPSDGSRDGYDLWGNRNDAATAAYNARPNAPPHIEMVNNLLPVLTDELTSNANILNESENPRKQLKKFLKAICVKPHCICFQCGYMQYPASVKKIVVDGLKERTDCRAYRVFKFYIDELEAAELAQAVNPNIDAANKSEVFLFKPTETGAQVYSCGMCEKKCKVQTARGQPPIYSQLKASELDLFDGWTPHRRSNSRPAGGTRSAEIGIGEYNSIGIGDEMPDEIACLNTVERMELSVLKMVDASFKAYSGPGYMHSSGGALLQPADFRGLAALLVHRAGAHESRNDRRMRRAIECLRATNPLVNNLLTCYERELRADDSFPCEAGAGGMPSIPEGSAVVGFQNSNDDGGGGVVVSHRAARDST